MVHIFLIVGDGSLAVELDPHKATAKQTGRATRCFLIRIFPNKQSGITVSILDAFISGLGDGLEIRRQLLARVLPHRMAGEESCLCVAKPCSPGCGMLCGCQKEVGTYVQIHVIVLSPPKKDFLHWYFPGKKMRG